MALRATVSGVVEIHAGAARSFALPSSSAVATKPGQSAVTPKCSRWNSARSAAVKPTSPYLLVW